MEIDKDEQSLVCEDCRFKKACNLSEERCKDVNRIVSIALDGIHIAKIKPVVETPGS